MDRRKENEHFAFFFEEKDQSILIFFPILNQPISWLCFRSCFSLLNVVCIQWSLLLMSKKEKKFFYFYQIIIFLSDEYHFENWLSILNDNYANNEWGTYVRNGFHIF
jgi:hypothetical protein